MNLGTNVLQMRLQIVEQSGSECLEKTVITLGADWLEIFKSNTSPSNIGAPVTPKTQLIPTFRSLLAGEGVP